LQTDFELAQWQQKADSAFEELKKLGPADQLTGLREKASEFEDVFQRRAFENLVFGRLQTYDPASENGKSTLLDKIFAPNGVAVGSFLLAFAAAFVEVGLGLIWSAIIAMLVAVLVRVTFRLFDRGFFFRRLFGVWFTGGLLFLGGPSLVLLLETTIGTLEWGGPPSIEAVVVWICGLVASGPLALWEARSGAGS